MLPWLSKSKPVLLTTPATQFSVAEVFQQSRLLLLDGSLICPYVVARIKGSNSTDIKTVARSHCALRFAPSAFDVFAIEKNWLTQSYLAVAASTMTLQLTQQLQNQNLSLTIEPYFSWAINQFRFKIRAPCTVIVQENDSLTVCRLNRFDFSQIVQLRRWPTMLSIQEQFVQLTKGSRCYLLRRADQFVSEEIANVTHFELIECILPTVVKVH